MNKWPYALFITAALSVLGQSALAQKIDCKPGEIAILLSSPVQQLNSPANPAVSFTLKRRNPSVACDYWVGFTKGHAPTYDRRLFNGTHQLDYDIFRTPSSPPLNLKSYPEAASIGEVYSGTFVKGGVNPNQHTYTSRPQMIAPVPGPFNIRPPGLYVDNVQIKVFEGKFPPSGAPSELASTTQSYSYNVPNFSALSLVNSGAPYTEPPITLKTLNFGTLTTGESLGFDMVLLYNSGYRITLNSQNGSRMKHVSKNSFVPYVMRVGGIPVTLNAGVATQVATGTGISPSAPTGHRIPVAVTIGTVAGGFAGTYMDSIGIVMTSL